MNITWKNCFRVGISIFILYICIASWSGISGLFIKILGAATPIIIGFFIAYVINIVMSLYEQGFDKLSNKNILKKAARPLSLVAALITVLLIVALVVYLVVPELVKCISILVRDIPKTMDNLLSSNFAKSLLPDDVIKNLSNVKWSDLISGSFANLSKGISGAAKTFVGVMSSVVSGTFATFIGIFFSIYFLLQKEKLSAQLDRVAGNYLPNKFYKKTTHVLSILNQCLRRYIVGQCTEAVILGVLCSLGMLIFRFPNAVMIGTLIGFTALIPFVGAYLGGAVGAIIILSHSPVKAFFFVIFLIILQTLEGNLIYPKVVGESIGLPAVWVLVAITLGGSLFGVLGMLLGVPIVATIYTLCREDLRKRESAKQNINTENL